MTDEGSIEILQPEGWSKPIGYANGIAVSGGGKLVFCAGQIGWNAEQIFEELDFVGQFGKALENIVAVVAEAGGKPEHICRMTAFCCDKPAYLAARRDLRGVWQRQMGDHYPCMSMIFVTDLLDNPGKVELEATAVVPD